MMSRAADPESAFTDLTRFELDRQMIRTLPQELCRRHHVVLLGVVPKSDEQHVPLGMLDPSDESAAAAVHKAIRWRFHRVQLNAHEIDSAIEFGFGDGRGSTTVHASGSALELSHDLVIRFVRQQSVPAMIADLLSQAIARRASDVHIENFRTDVDVRLRIDGVLVQVATPLSPANIKSVLSHVKILAGLDITERRRGQDGRISATYRDANDRTRQVDLRVAFLPGPHGEDAVLRVLDEGQVGLGLEELGMPTRMLEEFQRLITTPGGMLLVTGPTASGKTTTLYAALRHINHDGNKILTVEDPIEYHLPRINQKQVSEQMSFADYTRAFMRQNPDVVMIGEVRDEETAQIALRAAQMGHLVLTTLHTRDAPSAVARLASLGAEPSLLASGLLGVLAQRLVRRTCGRCAEPYQPTDDLLQRLPPLPAGAMFTHGRGCEACGQSGYRGQLGVFELLALDDSLRGRIAAAGELNWNAAPGARRMVDDAVDKAAAGLTTLAEIVRAVPVDTAAVSGR